MKEDITLEEYLNGGKLDHDTMVCLARTFVSQLRSFRKYETYKNSGIATPTVFDKMNDDILEYLLELIEKDSQAM